MRFHRLTAPPGGGSKVWSFHCTGPAPASFGDFFRARGNSEPLRAQVSG